METRDEFIKELKEEVDALVAKYESDADDEGRKMQCFKEHEELLEKYMDRLADSEYDVDECRQSLQALGSVCKTRLQKMMDLLNDNDPEINDDMPVDQKMELVFAHIENICIGTAATTVNGGICQLVARVGLLSENEIEAVIEMASKLDDEAFEKVAAQMEESMSEYDFDLGCDKNDVKLLENLMGEQYPEFDAFMGR